MAGTKRSSDDSGPTTRASKAAKTDNGTSPASKGKKGGKRGGGVKQSKANLSASNFKSKALPLHVNVTHTPPSIADADTVPSATADPGFLSTVALTATSFNTGSYGWKGTKRFSVELQGEGGEKETVQVMLTMNATVIGSKSAPADDEDKAEGDGEEKEDKEEDKDEKEEDDKEEPEAKDDEE